jgi:predicted ArsR family transcriptional regulator
MLRSMTDEPRRPATEEEAKALASSVRLRILRLCLDEPLTNREIATRLDANPATVLHHVRKLVDTGFLAPQHPRRGRRGAREVPYLATKKSWRVNSPGIGPVMVEAFLDELRRVDDPEQVNVSRLAVRLTDREYEELTGRIQELFEELAARPRTTTGRPYSLFFSLHPDVGRDVTPPAAT